MPVDRGVMQTFSPSASSDIARGRLLARLALALAIGCGLSVTAHAQAVAPAPVDTAARSSLGSYMAGRVARGENDVAAAARHYSHALTNDPASVQLLAPSFETAVTEGDWTRATKLAEQLVAGGSEHRMARLLMGIVEFQRGRFTESEALFKTTEGNPVGDLTSNIGRAWVKQAMGQTKDALELLEQPKTPESIQAFYRYHKALLADVAGRKTDARAAYERAAKAGDKTLRFALAFAQHASNGGDTKTAQAILQGQLDRARGEGHPMARAFAKQVDAGDRLPLIVTTPAEGLAEAFYGLGEVLMSEGGLGPGAMFLQYALYLQPKQPFALATLANVFEGTKKYDLANAAYDRVPAGTPLDTAIQIRKALNLNALDKVDDAQRLLEDIAKREPTNLVPLDTLGAIMRGHKRYDEAINYYNRAIASIQKPEAKHWAFYYSRGTSFERVKRWPQAEADLQMALKLAPEQPTVLNYLGYSWVDQGKNLKQGMALIEKAVRLKPDDGYIVDSLGWAHFRRGNFAEAAKWLERAVELRPEDPVLNDHLGDAFWRVGREREARFQWQQSLQLKPEPDDAEKINKKLTGGLPVLGLGKPLRPTKQAQKPDTLKRRTDAGATNPVQ
jgi:tetratricopeptide (TPR) repeat protein